MKDESHLDQRPESDYSRQTVKRRGLRTGYTTGSCAAAAAKAAAQTLLAGKPVAEVTIQLPVGRPATFAVHRTQQADGQVTCSVIKDGGDDPDVTHGAEICATVSVNPETSPKTSAKTSNETQILGGPGVGTVTRPGTGIAVGDPAITRVPKRMILESVAEAGKSHGLAEGSGFIVEISVPGGELIAEKTTNARLGVLGGISILGSTGVVQPYSTAAWRASVHLAIDVAAANDLPHLVLSTGTQSEAFTKRYLDLPDMAYIEAGIFSGPSLKRCVMRKVQRATHSGMVGKLSKMAMGYFVTHVAGNRVDTGFLASLAAQCGASTAVQEEMRQASSARHFQEVALSHGLGSVFSLMCQLVCQESRKLLSDDAENLVIDTLCFDFDGALLGQASTSPDGIQLATPPVGGTHG